MKKETFRIIDPIGLHARPASIVVAAASKFLCDVEIESNGQKGNLKSIMNVMAMGVTQGAEITILATGNDEAEALAEIKKSMIESNLIEKV